MSLFEPVVQQALALTTFSGLSTAIGGLLVVLNGQPSARALGHMMSFSAGVMIYISFMDLLSDATEQIGFAHANFWFFVGMAIFSALICVVPEPDAKTMMQFDAPSPAFRHRSAGSSKQRAASVSEKSRRELMMVGIITAFGISLHNFPEGLAVFLACSQRGAGFGLPLVLAIALHNIPEGMAVAAPILGASGSKWQAFKWSLLSGVCEPLAALVFGVTFSSYLTPYVVQASLAAVGGIMVFMSLRELLPAALQNLKPGEMMYSLVGGQAAIMFSVLLLRAFLGIQTSSSH